MKLVTAAQMQSLDRQTIEGGHVPSLTLMERAGAGVVRQMEEAFGALVGKKVTILCGKGNNGGDGLVVARLLRRRRVRVSVLLLHAPDTLSRDAKVMYRRFTGQAGRTAVSVVSNAQQVMDRLRGSDVIVDALLGTGLSTPVAGLYQQAITAINETGRRVVAVDLPSGIHADTGSALGAAVNASLTVTFGLPKIGLYTGIGIDHTGSIRIVDIGIPASLVEAIESHLEVMTATSVRALLPSRRATSHKGTYGHAGIIAGSVGKTGAAALAAKAALRVGAGLVTVATPASVNDVLEAKLLEAMTMPMPETKARTLARSSLDRLLTFASSRTAVALGPGLTTHPETVDLVQTFVRQVDKPCVLDADALNALAGRASLLTECKIPPILTPHPGEMARLEADLTAQTVNADRLGLAARFARERGVFLVLKGARTVVARPDGQVAVCPTGNPGMATAGTGDVLTGMIAGLLAQGLSQWDAACAAVYLHGLAGDLAAEALGQAAMTAGDLLNHLPQAFLRLGTR
jgi:NAD(P)H-hydrate epimerase